MTPQQHQRLDATALDSAVRLAPRPTSLDETGLPQLFVADLVSKHLSVSGVLDIAALARRTALPGAIVEELLAYLRTEGRAELRARRDNSPGLRFGLTERGRALAGDALQRDGYVGPAPVTLETYERMVRAQSMENFPLSRDQVHAAFSDVIIRPDLLDRLGPAMHSGRSMFIHGAAGTGKTYISRRLGRLLGPPVLLPHSLFVGDSVIGYFDPNVHRQISQADSTDSVLLKQGFDARFVLCERPVLTSGGELTIDMLDLQYDSALRRYNAPLQMRANTGMLIIDDLGRQRVAPVDLFNRWIVPLEEHRDQLTLNTGQHFSIPFDLVLVFSTNLPPQKLADDAFLRRIGYKIRFESSSRIEYIAIWRQVCQENGIEFDLALVEFVLDELYTSIRPNSADLPMLACHPRDLLGLGLDFTRYMGKTALSKEALRWAWHNYFVET